MNKNYKIAIHGAGYMAEEYLKLLAKIKYFKNELTSIKMKKKIKKILLKEKSNLPKFSNSSIIYMPMKKFFLEKWKTYEKNSTKTHIA